MPIVGGDPYTINANVIELAELLGKTVEEVIEELGELIDEFDQDPFFPVSNYYDLRDREQAGSDLADQTGHSSNDEVQAIVHTLTSATIAYEHSELEAEVMGNMREEVFPGDPRDSYRDRWNNEVGRRIADYAKDNNLPESAINDLVIDALKNGELIVDLNDPRIDPQNFDPEDVNWNAPAPNWQGSSGGAGGGVPPGGFPPSPPGGGGGAPGGGGTPGGGGQGGGEGGAGWHDPNGPFYDPPISPLVFDLDGDGLDIIALTESDAYFDLNENGFAEHTAWIGGDDGFLVRDLDSSGTIDDLSELFGGTEVDGFTRLAELDSNNDGLISAEDSAFGELKLWRDLDGDGLTDQGELQTLASVGISEIDLAADFIDTWVDDNWISHKSTYQAGHPANRHLGHIAIETVVRLSPHACIAAFSARTVSLRVMP